MSTAQPEWAVNALALAALPDLLERVDLEVWALQIQTLRAGLVDVLSRHGFAPLASDANWVLVDALGLREQLAPLGVVVRDCANFGMPGMMRIAVPGASGLERLDEALRAMPATGAQDAATAAAMERGRA